MVEIRGHRIDGGSGAVFVRPKPRTCPVCRNKFKYTTAWVYKRGQKIFCSYKCVGEYDKQSDRRREGGRIRNPASRASVTLTGEWIESRAGCLARIAYCRKMQQHFADKLKFYPEDNRYGIKNTTGAMNRWKFKEDEARKVLEKYGGADA